MPRGIKNKNRGQFYFLYRHERLDTGEIFYIGKGTSRESYSDEKSLFLRAYKREERSQAWLNVVNKTDFAVEIVFQSFDEDLILRKEVEFIKMYGRRDLGEGPLVNHTDGGEKKSNQRFTAETRSKMSEAHRKRYERGEPPAHANKIFVYTIDGSFYKEFPSCLACSKELGIDQSTIGRIAKQKLNQKTSGGFTFFYEFQGNKISEIPHGRHRPISCFNERTGLTKNYNNVREAASDLKIPERSIFLYLKRGSLHPDGYLFKDKKLNIINPIY